MDDEHFVRHKTASIHAAVGEIIYWHQKKADRQMDGFSALYSRYDKSDVDPYTHDWDIDLS